MTFSDLQNSVAYYLDDLNFGYFTATQVKVWINNAQRAVQKQLIKAGQNYYVRCGQTSLVVNQREYVLPDDFLKLHRLEIVMSGSSPNETTSVVAPITTNQQDLMTSGTGTPLAYSIRKNRLVLYPAPDAILTMRMQYSYEVTDMTLDSDQPDVPDQYHELIALTAAEDGFIKDGRSSDLLAKKLAEKRAELDSDAAERNQDTPRSVVVTESSGGFYF